MEVVARRRTVALPIPLRQAQIDVQGLSRVAAVNVCSAKAQKAYDEMNCVPGEEGVFVLIYT